MLNPILKIDHLSLGYDGVGVVSDFNLQVNSEEFISLLGPSGCGKTTILRSIAGLMPTMGGSITLNGSDITNLPPERRDVGIVFQNYALFPTMTAFENIAFALRVAGLRNEDIKARVTEIAQTSGIEEHLDKKPAALSGGQQQRVAIARALIMGNKVLLFDEPLSNLDAQVRATMRQEIKRLQRELKFTAIFVTHDQEEAMSLSDRIVVMDKGVAQQIGSPRELYAHPKSPFIAKFIGGANEIAPDLANKLGVMCHSNIFVRDHDIILSDNGAPAKVIHCEFLGPFSQIHIEIDGQMLSAMQFADKAYSPGDIVKVNIRDGSAHLFESVS